MKKDEYEILDVQVEVNLEEATKHTKKKLGVMGDLPAFHVDYECLSCRCKEHARISPPGSSYERTYEAWRSGEKIKASSCPKCGSLMKARLEADDN